MSAAQLLVGGAIGLGVGLVIGRKQAARGDGVTTCPVTQVSEWMVSKQMTGVLVTSRMDLPRVPLDSGLDAVVTQDTCTVFVQGPDSWVRSDELTTDLSTYLGGGDGPRRVTAAEPPISRPVP